ncbi:hypothetical protein [Rhodopirellula sallentina]|uniref:hypothetical protein n=1 Tax=Rhodopirellula sallentina TaxID=1263869 RepID=UPI0005C7B080|nr:hypothetical protein [Rhodopirellula sallentina]
MVKTKPKHQITTTKRDRRTYTHSQCGQATEISGFDFVRLANPYFFTMGSTVCCQCGPVPLREVAWDDTGETVAAYRRRLRSKRIWVWLFWPILIALGAGGGVMFSMQDNANRPDMLAAAGGVGVIIGIVVAYFIVPFIFQLTMFRDPRHID